MTMRHAILAVALGLMVGLTGCIVKFGTEIPKQVEVVIHQEGEEPQQMTDTQYECKGVTFGFGGVSGACGFTGGKISADAAELMGKALAGAASLLSRLPFFDSPPAAVQKPAPARDAGVYRLTPVEEGEVEAVRAD